MQKTKEVLEMEFKYSLSAKKKPEIYVEDHAQ